MQPVTLTIALLGSVLALALRPVGGLCVYSIILVAYPRFLTVQLGTIDFSAPRIIILALLANCLFIRKTVLRSRLHVMDLAVAGYFLGRLFAVSQNVAPATFLEREGGFFFDAVLPYAAVRFSVFTRRDLVAVLKCLMITGIPLALLGLYESVTGNNPVGFMTPYYAFGIAERMGNPALRLDLVRASVTFGNAIAFGFFFAALVPLCIGMWGLGDWGRGRTTVFAGILLLGIAASVSSAPLFSLVISIGMLAFFPFRKYWPILVAALLAMMLFVEVFSNRHFYHVLTVFSLDRANAYYRTGLLEEAFGGGMNGHWLFGYGYVGVGPGNDNTNFLWYHQDLVNIYIGILARFGLVGLVPYLTINALYYRALCAAARKSADPGFKWLVWCIAAALIGWNIAMMTASALGVLLNILFMLVAVCANMGTIAQSAEELEPRRQFARRLILLLNLQQRCAREPSCTKCRSSL